MSRTTIFAHVQGMHGVIEALVPDPCTVGDIVDALRDTGTEIESSQLIFVDEADEHESTDRNTRTRTLKQGSRVHVTRCPRVKVEVHYADQTKERAFPPGARVRSVKEWAVRVFNLSPVDAGEHVIQICESTLQPPTDTPLTELLEMDVCNLCFDLVPEKRVEG